jgi:multidrug resistance efflux pump
VGGHASREELEALRRERQALDADARKLELGEATPVEVLRRSVEVLERTAEVERLDLEVRLQSLRQAVERSRSELAKGDLALSEASLRAPIDGVVTERRVEVGGAIQSGATAFVIAPHGGYLFEAVVDSADAGHLAVGMPARIAIDTFDAQTYGTIDGTVSYVSADSAADSADGAGLRYVVRVEVPTDVIGRGDHLAPLRLGLGGRLRVVVGRERVMALFLADLEDRFDVEWSP